MNILDRQRMLDERRAKAGMLSVELRDARIRLLASVFTSADLRAAAETALAQELEDSVYEPMPCDEVLRRGHKP